MKLIKVWGLMLLLMFCFSGCKTTSSSVAPSSTQAASNQEGVLEAMNEGMIGFTGFWQLGMGSLEYIGDKTQDTFDYLAEVYQSI